MKELRPENEDVLDYDNMRAPDLELRVEYSQIKHLISGC